MNPDVVGLHQHPPQRTGGDGDGDTGGGEGQSECCARRWAVPVVDIAERVGDEQAERSYVQGAVHEADELCLRRARDAEQQVDRARERRDERASCARDAERDRQIKPELASIRSVDCEPASVPT